MSKPVAFIAGALTGIGRATAIAFAKDGARLVVSGRRETEGKALEAEHRRLGAEASFIQADIRREDEVRELWVGPADPFGARPLRQNARRASFICHRTPKEILCPS